MTHILFVSKGMQLLLSIILIAIVLIFIKGATLETKIKQIEDKLRNYLTIDEFLETSTQLVEDRLNKAQT